jgi:hypothetical protein
MFSNLKYHSTAASRLPLLAASGAGNQVRDDHDFDYRAN